MKISTLYEMSPLVFELFKSEVIRICGHCAWEICSSINVELRNCFEFKYSPFADMWNELQYENGVNLLKQWEAKQFEGCKTTISDQK